jgi:PKD repeat protein
MRSHALRLTILSLGLALFAISPLSAQPLEFQRLFGNNLDNRFNKVLRLGEDYYALGADEPTEGATPHATLTKLNGQGQIQWTIRLGVPSVWNDIIATDEGNLMLVGGTMPFDLGANSILGVATPAGNFLWVNFYNFSNREILSKVVRHPNPANPDFPYYVLGIVQQPNGNSNDDIHMLNIDAEGTVNWRRKFGTNPDEEFFRDMEILSNGNLLLVGHTGTSAVSVQVDVNGSVVSGNTYSSGMRIYDAVERPGSAFYFAGTSTAASPAQISRLNPNFQPVWSRTIPQLTFLNRVWIGPDNALYALGYGTFNGLGRNVVLKIVEVNNNPSIQWVKILNGAETAYNNGNIFLLEPDQIAYVDGRTDHPSGFGKSDAFLSVSNLDLETCITQPGPSLSMSNFALASSAYSVQSAPESLPLKQDIPFQGLSWQQTAICGSSCEPVNTNTFSTILLPANGAPEIELALDGFQASNGEVVALGLSTAFSPFSLDLTFTRLDDEGNLLADPQYLDFTYNGGELELLIDSETQANAHMTEVFDASGNSQGYFLAATMFNTQFPSGGASTLDVLAALIDHSGCVVWSRFIERPQTDEYARDVLQMTGGDLVVLAQRSNPANGENNMELFRFSLNGQTCSDRVFLLPSTEDFFPSAICNVEGLINPTAAVAVGGYWKLGQRFLAVYLLQSDLNLATASPLLYDILEANPEETPIPTDILQKGQNLVVGGYLTKNSPDREAFLMEIRPYTPSGQIDGLPLWTRRLRFNASNNQYANGYRIYGLKKTDADELVVAGAAIGANDSVFRAFMMKTNPEGMVQWINLFPGTFGAEQADNAFAYDLDITPAGDLLLSGYRPRPDQSDGFFWMGKTDPNGNLNDCDCFDPLTLQVEALFPIFSTTFSSGPMSLDCDGGLAIPQCTAFSPSQLFCDQYAPPPLCQAAFEVQNDDGCGAISFANNSTGILPQFLWQFGDPLNSTSSEENPEFTYLSPGTYTVCLTVTTADCSDTHCQEVTVELLGAPASLTCPPDITIQPDPGACENTSYQLPEATVVDNCPCDPLLDITYSTGYEGPYLVGQQTFTVTAIDACGVVSCEVTVTVDDGEAPLISCPADITLDLDSPVDPSVTGEATATDPCGDPTINYSDAVVFDNGCEITIERSWVATDAAGNADTCVQTINRIDPEPIQVTCPGNIEVLADPGACTAVVEGLEAQVSVLYSCFDNGLFEFGVSLTGATLGSEFGTFLLIEPFNVGLTTVEVWGANPPSSYASCTFTVTVTEDTPPVITCPDVVCTTEAVVEWNDPVAEDNCGIAELTCSPASGSTFPPGPTEVVCTATDVSGNTAQCTFIVEVIPAAATAEFSFESTNACGDAYQFTPVFQDAGFNYAWDFGDGNTSAEMAPAHAFESSGLYTVTLTLSTPSGCFSTASATVEAELQLQGTFTWELDCKTLTLTGTPDDPSITWSWDLPGGPLQGAVVEATFPDFGVYEVCATLTDGSCALEVCETIAISENEPPVVSCPQDVTVEAAPGANSAVATFDPATAVDNCSDVVPVCEPASGSEFAIGTTEVTCSAIDESGNEGFCTFLVTVLPFVDSCCVDSLGFVANVNAGFSWSLNAGCEYVFVPDQLNDCQQVLEWSWGDGEVSTGPFTGSSEIIHTFSESGEYVVCMQVAELDELTGAICWEAVFCDTLLLECGDLCAMNEHPLATGYDYAAGGLYDGNGVADAYWQDAAGATLITAEEAGGLPPLPGSRWLVPMQPQGYRDHEIAFKFCLPDGSFDCTDLIFDLGIQAWAFAEVRLNGRPVSAPLFLSPYFGEAGNWLYQPTAADCGLFREGDNYLSVHLKTVYGAAGLNVAGSISTQSGAPLLGLGDCCDTSPSCACDDFDFDGIEIVPSPLFEGNPCVRAFRPEGIDECDEVEWYVNATLAASGQGGEWVYMLLPEGAGEVCLRVTRTDPDGNFCGVIEKCWPFIIECGDAPYCVNGLVSNPGMDGMAGALGQGGSADPWQAAYGTPYLFSGPGALDLHSVILSGNADEGDAFYQEIDPEVGQTYQLSLNAMRYLPVRPGENTRLIVRIADQPQTSASCTGTCQTIATIHDFSDAAWYRHVFSWQPFSPSLKYLTILVENDFEDDGTPASRSYIQVDNVCLDFPNSVSDRQPAAGIRVYPNPTSGDAILAIDQAADADLQLALYDLWGRAVWTGLLPRGESRLNLNLSKLPPAVYWLEAKNEAGGVWREKLLKQ